eukprot:3691814-Pleurochrysis_carterae.AAC.1
MLSRGPPVFRFRSANLISVCGVLTAKVSQVLQRRRQASAHKKSSVFLRGGAERALWERDQRCV